MTDDPPRGRFFEEFEVGETGETESRTITEEDVEEFARISWDRNPLHMDEAYARTTIFGGRIAHGILGLAVASGLLNRMGMTRGTLVAFLGLRWDFREAVRIGDTIRVRASVAGLRETSDPEQGLLQLGLELVREGAGDGGQVLQEGRFTLLVRRRPRS